MVWRLYWCIRCALLYLGMIGGIGFEIGLFMYRLKKLACKKQHFWGKCFYRVSGRVLCLSFVVGLYGMCSDIGFWYFCRILCDFQLTCWVSFYVFRLVVQVLMVHMLACKKWNFYTYMFCIQLFWVNCRFLLVKLR